MGKNYIFKCSECNEEVEFHRPSNYDGPDVCPKCQSCDTLEDTEEDEGEVFDKKEVAKNINEFKQSHEIMNDLFSSMNDIFSNAGKRYR